MMNPWQQLSSTWQGLAGWSKPFMREGRSILLYFDLNLRATMILFTWIFSQISFFLKVSSCFPLSVIIFEKRFDEKVPLQIGCFSTTQMEEISINELSHLEREIVNNNMIGWADRRDSFLRAW